MKTDRSFLEWVSIGATFAAGIVMTVIAADAAMVAVETIDITMLIKHILLMLLSSAFIGYGLRELFGDSESAE